MGSPTGLPDPHHARGEAELLCWSHTDHRGKREHYPAPPAIRRRSVPSTEPLRFPMREQDMADKSPRQSMSKKFSKSINEKRTERRSKADTHDPDGAADPGQQALRLVLDAHCATELHRQSSRTAAAGSVGVRPDGSPTASPRDQAHKGSAP